MKRTLALAAVALVLAACAPSGPKPPEVLNVVTTPLYVAQCHDVDGPLNGPCVDQVGDSGMWIYVPDGSWWPNGQRIELCPTEDGGPVPCAWLPSVQGNYQGDSGAYVYGVKP